MVLDGLPSATESLGPCGGLGYQSLLNSIAAVEMQLQPKETSHARLIINERLWIDSMTFHTCNMQTNQS